MADKSKMEWCDATWDPVIGCSKVSAGCENCFAHRTILTRFPYLTGEHFNTDTTPDLMRESSKPISLDERAIFIPERLEISFHWKKPRRIFVCSMSDLFHESLTNEQIAAVFGVMAATPQHQYVVLTKRLHRAVEWFRLIENQSSFGRWRNGPSLECAFHLLRQAEPDFEGPIHCRYGPNPDAKWPLENVIMCASVENQPAVDERVSLLFQIPARWRGVSVEPMLEGIDVRKYIGCDCEEFWPGQGHPPDCPTQTGQILNLVICGAETGPGKRPFKDEWALDLRDQCKTAGTPFFFKKDGSGKPTLCGVEYHEWVK
jgi:protein gp37